LQWHAGGGAQLAREAQHRHRVATVGRDADLDQGLVEPEHIAQRRTEGRIGCQFDDAGVAAGQLQLGGRTEHAGRLDAAEFRCLDGQAARQLCADSGERSAQSRARIGCATDDLQRLAAAGVDAAHAQLVGLRMRFGARDLGDHDARERRRHRCERLDLEAQHRHAGAELGVIPGDGGD
jgi:hypothetical protein